MERYGALFGQMFTYYSSPLLRLDEWVLEMTNAARSGVFVEIYAGDGVMDSNTLALEKNGWIGTLVEPDAGLFSKLQQNRPKCALLNASLDFGQRKNESLLPVTLGTILSAGPMEVDFLVLLNQMEVAVLDTYFTETPLAERRRFNNLAVGWGLNAMKLERIRRVLEPQGYILKQLRGWCACFQTKSEASRPMLAY